MSEPTDYKYKNNKISTSGQNYLNSNEWFEANEKDPIP